VAKLKITLNIALLHAAIANVNDFDQCPGGVDRMWDDNTRQKAAKKDWGGAESTLRGLKKSIQPGATLNGDGDKFYQSEKSEGKEGRVDQGRLPEGGGANDWLSLHLLEKQRISNWREEFRTESSAYVTAGI